MMARGRALSLLLVACAVIAFGKCDFPRAEFSNLTLEEDIRRHEEIDGVNVRNALSRKKRYLVFPEGSSLQLVFCLTYTTNIMIADIFYMGATAALAWQLPQDPYSPFDHHAEALHRNDKGELNYKDSNYDKQDVEKPVKNILVNRYTGKPIQPNAKKQFIKKYDTSYRKYWKKPNHRRKIIINPALAKRSVDKVDRKVMHHVQKNRDYLKVENMDWKSVDFHRTSRKTLYEKIERLLRGMGHDGRHCVLKALCEMGQDSETEQGSFLEEIMRAIFTLPRGKDFDSSHHKAYDDAHISKENCSDIFPKCSTSLGELFPK